MNDSQADLLLSIADLTEVLDPIEFNIYVFWRDTPCGSVGCVLGHAVHAGLTQIGFGDRWGAHNQSGDPSWEDDLGLNHSEFMYLFGCREWENDPVSAAKRIRKVVGLKRPDRMPPVEKAPSVKAKEEVIV